MRVALIALLVAGCTRGDDGYRLTDAEREEIAEHVDRVEAEASRRFVPRSNAFGEALGEWVPRPDLGPCPVADADLANRVRFERVEAARVGSYTGLGAVRREALEIGASSHREWTSPEGPAELLARARHLEEWLPPRFEIALVTRGEDGLAFLYDEEAGAVVCAGALDGPAPRADDLGEDVRASVVRTLRHRAGPRPSLLGSPPATETADD